MPPGTSTAQREIVVQGNPTVVAVVLVTAGVIGWKAYRVKQAADRAREKSDQYFGLLPEYSSKRDAYRHIFWNMQMRRYVGSFFAKLITDYHADQGNNPPNDLVMDYHNNDVGREVRYKNFRGHRLWDRWDWKEWAEKVRNYINTPSNEEYVAEWRTNPPATYYDAKSREVVVPDWKYIYFVTQ